MFEESRDLLNVAIAVSVLGLTAVSCCAVFYLAMILRQSFKIVKEMRDRMHKIDELIKTVKEKLEHTTSYLLLIGEGVKKLVEVIEEKIDKKDAPTASARKKGKKK